MLHVWTGFLMHFFDKSADRRYSYPLSYSDVGEQGLLPVGYRDFEVECWGHRVFVSLFLQLSSAQPHGETIEDKFGLVRKRLEVYVNEDCLVVVTFGTFVEVHWWEPQIRPVHFMKDFEASGGSLTRIFKVDLTVDNEKMSFKQYLSLVKDSW